MLAQLLTALAPTLSKVLEAQAKAAEHLLGLAQKLEAKGDLKEARQALTAVLRLKLPTPTPATRSRHAGDEPRSGGESPDRAEVHKSSIPARSRDSAAKPASSRACLTPFPPLTPFPDLTAPSPILSPTRAAHRLLTRAGEGWGGATT